MPMTNPAQFISQVRAEAAKIIWPARREVMTTTLMVFVMAGLFSLFFFVVDLLIRSGVSAVLRTVG
ncbi:MAG TPA: preprotein translocase subunit SecE [Paracoccus sp.]|nr:preprotein translocase subunit SecE [Paracoccus sp. (in: a-proteobacteria)]